MAHTRHWKYRRTCVVEPVLSGLSTSYLTQRRVGSRHQCGKTTEILAVLSNTVGPWLLTVAYCPLGGVFLQSFFDDCIHGSGITVNGCNVVSILLSCLPRLSMQFFSFLFVFLQFHVVKWHLCGSCLVNQLKDLCLAPNISMSQFPAIPSPMYSRTWLVLFDIVSLAAFCMTKAEVVALSSHFAWSPKQ